ncbi:uncharacterized protein UPF0158 [Paenibacillus sp. BK033]|uniref:UPF0158 family protein n=1 Tax=Paenibacillus sp. BK033 TaxID=2512133 RepID=UPI00104AAFDC|nr:UPF0158 family protein [Paenibacillus sp. BK033]NIK72082.1 hypothetical protein [Paenibacillus sp. BK720]TCM88538.1 uncharacterized protein UPF0158 [Paenibacillus sp. BK033]
MVKVLVSLDQLVSEIEIGIEDTFTYIDVTTGEVITLTREEIRAAEDEQPLENFPEWQRENIQRAICILEDEQEKYADFTLKNDYNEYELIEEFISTLEDEEMNEALNTAIIGKGAFRRFKDKIIQFGIDKQWYTYKENKIKELVIEWCIEHDIEFQK